jgi:hypothetical protein
MQHEMTEQEKKVFKGLIDEAGFIDAKTGAKISSKDFDLTKVVWSKPCYSCGKEFKVDHKCDNVL